MLGEGNLARILTGQFYEPHEEERIFMFIDLQSSTELAEQLGHIKYSRLIQDCFNDLSVTSKYYAQIYQYVGDEAVLTWEIDRGIQNDNCLNAFFAFKKQLESRKEHYLKEYNHLPFFKAGLNCGIVCDGGRKIQKRNRLPRRHYQYSSKGAIHVQRIWC